MLNEDAMADESQDLAARFEDQGREVLCIRLDEDRVLIGAIRSNVLQEGFTEVSAEMFAKVEHMVGAVRLLDGGALEPFEPVRPVILVDLSRRQMASALAEDDSPFKMMTWDEAEAFAVGLALPNFVTQALLRQPDETARRRSRMFLLTAATFERHHPETAALGFALDWTGEQLDALWAYGGGL